MWPLRRLGFLNFGIPPGMPPRVTWPSLHCLSWIWTSGSDTNTGNLASALFVINTFLFVFVCDPIVCIFYLYLSICVMPCCYLAGRIKLQPLHYSSYIFHMVVVESIYMISKPKLCSWAKKHVKSLAITLLTITQTTV